jgi:hypothetical protein
MTEDEIKDVFREMREDAVPADSMALVRLRVEGRIRRRAQWKTAGWVMAGAMVILAALITHPRPAIHKPTTATMAARRLDAPPVELPQATPRVTVRPAIQRKLSRRRHQTPSEAVTIRIETPDPDVVILLVGQ